MGNKLKTINHTVVVNHPGEKKPVETILTEVQDSNGLPFEYYMDVESVICLKQVCKVIPVRLYWNNLGEYKRYKLQTGATLEKYEADLFNKEDYIKLQSILSNKNSPFKDVGIDEVLTVVDESSDEDIDVFSGATALELDEKDTVPGAALTCYTLWHWANGDIVSIIKKITGDSATNEHLQNFLIHDNKAYYYMALEQLIERHIYTEQFLDLVITEVLKDDNLIKPSLQYLEIATPEIYFASVKKIFVNGGQKERLAVMKSLQSTKYKVPMDYLDSFGKEIVNLKFFQEVSAFLELMKSKNINSKIITDGLIPLLQGDFIIARRVYWFISNEQLGNQQKQKIDEFYSKYKNQL